MKIKEENEKQKEREIKTWENKIDELNKEKEEHIKKENNLRQEKRKEQDKLKQLEGEITKQEQTIQ